MWPEYVPGGNAGFLLEGLAERELVAGNGRRRAGWETEKTRQRRCAGWHVNFSAAVYMMSFTGRE